MLTGPTAIILTHFNGIVRIVGCQRVKGPVGRIEVVSRQQSWINQPGSVSP